MQIGLQPHTIRALDEPMPAKIERLARVGYQGVELGVDDDAGAVHDALAETGLSATSIGTGLEQLEGDIESHVEACEAFDCDGVVVMWLGEEHWTSRDAVEDTAALLDEWADRLDEYDLDLHYHNHDHEFTDLGDTTGYEAFLDVSDAVNLELDLGWVGCGGVDPTSLLDRVGDRATLVHFKDMDFENREFVTFGEGDLDLEAAVETARDNGVEWGIVENDEPNDPVAEPGHASVVLDRFTGHYC